MYNILLVEDEKIIREGLKAQINWEQLGFQIIAEAGDGCAALEKFSEVKTIDAILTDIRMPYMDGLEMLNQIRQQNNDVSIVVLSGYDDFTYAKKCIEYKVFDYILKPSKDEAIIDVFTRLQAFLDEKNKEKGKIDKLKDKEITLAMRDLNRTFHAFFHCESNTTPELTKTLTQLGMVNKFGFYLMGFCVCGDSVNLNLLDTEELFIHLSQALSVASVITDQAKQQIIVVLTADCTQTSVKLYESARMLMVTIEGLFLHLQNTSVKLNAVISTFSGELSLVRALYSEIDQLFQLRFFYGNGRVYTHVELEHHLEQRLQEEHHDLETYIDAVAVSFTAKDEALQKKLTVLCQKILSISVSTEQVYFQLLNIWNRVVAVLCKDDVKALSTLQIDFYDEIKEMIDRGSMEDIIQWFLLTFKLLQSGERKYGDKNRMMIEKVQKQIKNNLSEKISLKQTAESVYMSPTYFSILFKRYTGENFSQYLTQARINKAKELLEAGENKIYEIAAMIGYDDYRHFSKIFYKTVGKKPTEYQKNFHKQ